MGSPVLGIDTGGTFTDLVVITDGRLTVHKLPSTPDDPARAAGDGAASLDLPSDTMVVHGSTVATNALLERKGAKTALITTEGFEDVIQIGRQARSNLYDLEYVPPASLVPPELRFGLAERVGADGTVLVEPAASALRDIIVRVVDSGAEAVAVSLLFSFLHPRHEQLVVEALRAADQALFVTASSDVLPEFREFERTSTLVVNAYVGPLMSAYLDRLQVLLKRPLRVMQSSGGGITVELARRQPVRTILSGPAGGVIGATYVAAAAGYDRVMTFDMGGTSTDVSLCPGRLQMATDYEVGGVPIGVPVIDIHTVGAGGGSIASIDGGGALRVGPESAGASPGPACYGAGTEATVTDANLLLGRLVRDRFLGGRMEIDESRAAAAVDAVAATMGTDRQTAALGIVRVANAVMERALRTVSLQRGFDPREFTLVAFGGAGPQHACELAESLGVTCVLVPRYPGLLSAVGVAIADVRRDYSRTVMVTGADNLARVDVAFGELEAQAGDEMTSEGFESRSVLFSRTLDVRYRGQSFELPMAVPQDAGYNAIASAFHVAHAARFGYADERAPVEVVNVRVQAIVASERPTLAVDSEANAVAERTGSTELWFDDGATTAPIYERDRLGIGATFAGPAVVVQMDATTVVPPGWRGVVAPTLDLVLTSVREGA